MRHLLLLLIAVSLRAWALDVGPLPPSTTWVIAIEVQRVLSSPLGTLVRKAFDKPDHQQRLADFTALTGIDPLRDINQIVIGGQDFTPQSSFVVVQGRFDGERLSRLVAQAKGHEAMQAGGATIHRWIEGERDAHADERFGSLTGDRLILTSARPIMDVMIASAAGAGEPSPTVAAVNAVDAPVVLAGSASNLARLSRINQSASMLNQVQNMLITVAPVGTQTQVSATLNMADTTTASQVGQIFKGFALIAANSQDATPETRQLITTCQVDTSGTDVHLGIAIPYDYIDRAVSGSLTPGSSAP